MSIFRDPVVGLDALMFGWCMNRCKKDVSAALKEAELEAQQKREAKKHAQTEIRTYLQQQIDEKNSKKQKAAEDERKFCDLVI